MKIEKLGKNHRKKVIGGLIVISVMGVLGFNLTKAKYQNIEDIELVKGEVNYKLPDFKMMAMYQNNNGSYEEVSELPGKNYKINESKSYCTINNVDKDNKAKLYTDKYGQHVIESISKNDKCYLYFDKNTEIVNTVLGSIEVNNYTPDFSETATTDEGIFKAEDNDGVSYYWRGATTTNYLKFGGYCWRIIRINGDGTIRLIYDGTTCHNNGEVTTDSIAVANIAYNAAFGKSEYVGWTYTEGLQRPNSTIEGTNAPIKTVLENWYNNNLKSYEEKIADGKFCNDRNVQSGQSWSSTSSNTYYYAPSARTYTNYAPTLCCTVLDTYILKVGLIISDEVMYAGGKNVDNDSYYLYNGQNYWTMTPHSWLVGTAASWVWAFYVHSTGYFNAYGVDNKFGVRPVINLRSDIKISGNGTKDNPYVVLN
jgi:hypothetical protein